MFILRFSLFFIAISLYANDTNSLSNITDLNTFLNQSQNVYYLKIHNDKNLNIILTGETIFESNIKRIDTHSCFKIIFW
jgi:hypothetical protein